MSVHSITKLAMIAGISFSAMAFGAAAPAATPAAAPAAAVAAPATAAPVAKASTKAPKAMSFSGTVVSTDAIASSIVVKGSKGEETFSLAATGKIMLGKAEVKLADVTKDQKVKVTYMEDAGVKTASAIKVSVAPAKKEAKTSTAAAPQ